MRGIRAERELVKALESFGVIAIRIPASGAARKAVLPDIIAAYSGRVALIEVKHAKTVYIKKERLEALAELARHFGGEAYVAFRPKGSSEYFFIPASEASGRLDRSKAISYENLEGFVRRYFLRKPDVLDML